MAITVTVPSHVGPGYLIHFGGLTGPVPVDDYVVANVQLPAGSNNLTAGDKLARGFTNVFVTLGMTEKFVLASSLDQYLAPGGAVTLFWYQFHANGTLVDSGTVTGLLWDPTGGMFALTQQVLQRVGGSTGDLAAILAAVRRSYVSP